MKVGVAGCGGMGQVHANKYREMPDVELWAFDLDSQKLEQFCQTKCAKAATSLAHLIETCEAIDVCLPTHTHCEVANQSLTAGKATLVEKPMARTAEQCQSMIDTAKEHGALLVPAQVVRFFPEFRRAHELIKEGLFGLPASVRLRRGGGLPKAEWFLDEEKSGGILLDLAVHEFDWLLWTIGTAISVSSRTVRQSPHDLSNIPGDFALTTITFASGCIAHVESTWMDPSGTRVTLEASGSKGLIEYDSRINPSLRTHTQGSSVAENNYSQTDDPYYKQLRAFVLAASGQQPPVVSAEDGMAAVQLACMAIESAKKQDIVWL